MGLGILVLVIAVAAALVFDDRPADRSRRSPAASTSTPPSRPEEPTSFADAASALTGIVFRGLDDGTIGRKAADEVLKKLQEVVERLDEGDEGEAIDKLRELEEKLQERVEKGELQRAVAMRLGRAIEDVREAISAA